VQWSRCLAVAGAAALAFAPPAAPASPAINVRVLRFVDHSRSIRLPDGRRVPRTIETVVRYPTASGAYPLVVFGHGFALTPATYGRLLDAWAEAGYVVAAPAFPLGNAGAPGGPNESDIVNQPRDMSFVITRLLALNAQPKGVLEGSIEPSRIAVAGHSDGAVTALAVAYGRRYGDSRVRAAIVLSGAMLAGMGPLARTGPPLLAMQGTADPINPPSATSSYFDLVSRPKFLVWLLGASHRHPYTDQQPQLAVVERATIAFLDHYLKGLPLAAFTAAAQRPGVTRLVADP
jgi:pimeloyl-ACP methyl ester carboxylesterase